MKDLIDAVIKIANNEKVVSHLEPNLMQHFDVKEWMVTRILYAYCLLIEEANKDVK